jgi:hypothetical protein
MKAKTTIEIDVDPRDKKKCSITCTGYRGHYYCELFCVDLFDGKRCHACLEGEIQNG